MANIPFGVRKHADGKRVIWQVVRVGDHTVLSTHKRQRDAILAAGALVRDGADPGPSLTVQELQALGRFPTHN